MVTNTDFVVSADLSGYDRAMYIWSSLDLSLLNAKPVSPRVFWNIVVLLTHKLLIIWSTKVPNRLRLAL
jgi:hypothetical protein